MAEYDIDIGHSYVIGDKVVDLELALRAGARPVLVLTGYGRTTLERIERLSIRPAFICENLLEAARCIIGDAEHWKPAAD
jgi:D-glycero-D-manno-heptose 1,7-bisphosphate phosphatase